MKRLPQNETRERIMHSAEKLFMSRGYSAVKLRDIAEAVGMKHASLYYYVPKGKDQLYAEVVRYSMRRHREQLHHAIAQGRGDFSLQLQAVSDWIISQPPLDMGRMLEVDLKHLSEALQVELGRLVLDALNEPLIALFSQVHDKGIANIPDPTMASMSLLTILQGVQRIPDTSLSESREQFARRVVDMLLHGWLAR